MPARRGEVIEAAVRMLRQIGEVVHGPITPELVAHQERIEHVEL